MQIREMLLLTLRRRALYPGELRGRIYRAIVTEIYESVNKIREIFLIAVNILSGRTC